MATIIKSYFNNSILIYMSTYIYIYIYIYMIITYRNYRFLDYDCFASELKLLLLSLPCSIDSLNDALSYLIDKFAHLKTRTINNNSNFP